MLRVTDFDHLTMGLYLFAVVCASGLLRVQQGVGEKSQRETSLMHLTVFFQAWWTCLGKSEASLQAFSLGFYVRQRWVDLSILINSLFLYILFPFFSLLSALLFLPRHSLPFCLLHFSSSLPVFNVISSCFFL